ncbi:ATP-dependent nuclease [Burkholderia pseudomallei]|uniref:ATP-dependent nuclease n=1 Tax=Burkholderia pseudomallei TaxID=28450 RepID=UPI00294614D3|nr:ATP-dependent endonuclease [Burkholderia pseudomallei]
MRVARLSIENFRGIHQAELHFTGHTLLVGGNNIGKSTVCEALDLVLGPDRLNRNPPVEEFDFRNAGYLAADGETVAPIRIEAILVDLTNDIKTMCANNLEFWHKAENRLLGEGEIGAADNPNVEFCLRLITLARYDVEEDQFVARTIYGRSDEESEDERKAIPVRVKRAIGFLYLRTVRTGSRALSLERGTLLDNILRMKEARKGMWERIRRRLSTLAPPVDADATELGPILDEIEARLAEYIAPGGEGRSTRLFVSQLTREHLRKTIAFFLTMGQGEEAVPFQQAGSGTLNTLVLALLTFIADIKKDNVIFAMEEPEIALPPYTQRRIANYLLEETSQCFVTSHSPYVIERFEPDGILKLNRDEHGVLSGTAIKLPDNMKTKNYRQNFRRAIAEAMLGKGVIVGEGITEQDALLVVAQKMEDSNNELFPLDVAGISVINADGDGNLEKLGSFFREIGIPAFAFFDRKNRTDAQVSALQGAYVIAKEIAQKGAEALMAAETPLDRQWQYLEALRENDREGHFGIPAQRSADDDDDVRKLTVSTLKGLKGEGGAAKLLELCTVAELPPTITAFLSDIYQRYPKPKRKKIEAQEPAAALGDGPQEVGGA